MTEQADLGKGREESKKEERKGGEAGTAKRKQREVKKVGS